MKSMSSECGRAMPPIEGHIKANRNGDAQAPRALGGLADAVVLFARRASRHIIDRYGLRAWRWRRISRSGGTDPMVVRLLNESLKIRI